MTCFVLRSIFTVRSPPSTTWAWLRYNLKICSTCVVRHGECDFHSFKFILELTCLIQGNLKCFHEIALSCWPLKNCAHGALSEIPRDGMFIENHPSPGQSFGGAKPIFFRP